MFRAALPFVAVATLALVACGNDASTLDTSVTAPTETTAATPATDSPTTEAPPTEARPTEVATTNAGEESVPLTMSAPKRIGAGLLEDWSPDGAALIVGRVDEKLSEQGCEGVDEPVYFLQPVDGGASTVAFPGHVEINGSFVGTQPGTGDVVMLDGCEGYLGDLSVSHQDPNGILSDPRLVAIADTAQSAELTGVSTLSLDGSALLLTGKSFAGDVEKVVSTRIDLATGATVAIDTGGLGGAHIAEVTGGRYVVSDGKAVSLVAADGALVRTYEGTDFGVSRDGSHIAVVGNGTLGMAIVGEDVASTVALPKAVESALLVFSPDGSSVAVLSYDEAGSVAVVRAGVVHVVAEGESYGRLAWNPVGTAIAFNRFSGDFAVEDVMVASEVKR